MAVVWSTPSLPPTGPITLQFAVDPDINLPEGTQFISKANISATNAAPKSGAAFSLLVGEPDIDVAKAGNRDIIAGEDLNYRITVQNVGTVVAPGVTLVDTLPAGVTYKSASITPDTVNGQILIWDLGNVTEGNQISIDWSSARIRPYCPKRSITLRKSVTCYGTRMWKSLRYWRGLQRSSMSR